MRLYLDQMLRADLAERLRAEGHDVVRTEEVGQETADDAAVLQAAIEAGRVPITLDEHFGDWSVLPLDRHPGVVRLKVHPTTIANAASLLVPFLAAHEQEELRNRLVVLSRTSERWIRTSTDD